MDDGSSEMQVLRNSDFSTMTRAWRTLGLRKAPLWMELVWWYVELSR